MRVLRLKLCASRSLRVVHRPRVRVVRAVHSLRDLSKTIAPKTSILESAEMCSVNKRQACEFNRCYLNFDKLDEEAASHCVTVADQILEVDCKTSICDEDVCTERAHVDWFKTYMSNAYGL